MVSSVESLTGIGLHLPKITRTPGPLSEGCFFARPLGG